MKTITLQEAFDILENCSAIIIDNVVTYPSLSDLEGSDDNQFLYISWENEGLEYSITFEEAYNGEVKISGSSMFLFDNEGDEVQITILNPQNLE